MEIYENVDDLFLDREIWKNIEGYDGDYQVSNFGRVKSFKKYRGKDEKILKQLKHIKGYLQIQLSRQTLKVHRLVLETFNPIENMENLQVNHINGIKSNNILENLEWCTPSENMKHAFKIGLENNQGTNHPQSILTDTDVIKIRKLLENNNYKRCGLTLEDIGKLFGVSKSTIVNIKYNKKYWSHIKKVGLFGTCCESTWRKKLISMLKIDYFNPVVDDWTYECQQEEFRQKEICDYCLYTITPKMTGLYSIAEVVDDSNKRPEKTILCILKEDDEKIFDEGQMRSLDAIGKMVFINGGTVFYNLENVAEYLNYIIEKKEK